MLARSVLTTPASRCRYIAGFNNISDRKLEEFFLCRGKHKNSHISCRSSRVDKTYKIKFFQPQPCTLTPRVLKPNSHTGVTPLMESYSSCIPGWEVNSALPWSLKSSSELVFYEDKQSLFSSLPHLTSSFTHVALEPAPLKKEERSVIGSVREVPNALFGVFLTKSKGGDNQRRVWLRTQKICLTHIADCSNCIFNILMLPLEATANH